jgi:hypothetical protein
MTRFPTDPIADRAADDRPSSHGEEENEEIDLGRLHGNVETLDEIEGVVVRQTHEIDVL